MTRTVQQLIEQLQGYPGNAVITIEDATTDQQYAITTFEPTTNGLNIVIEAEEEEDDPSETEG
ncbi:MAG: hypothetical protein V7K26_00170 [Nostoc sp.]|uniref:hypothetical protein n=1 Tax=Nostoc sp. TaxID=1180 RepID=UPI002FF3E8F7